MPKIQGTQRTVETRTARLTPASTAGYGASGAAYKVLGNQVAKAGNDISGAFEAAQEKRDGAHDRMTILETSISADKALDDHNRNYTGSGKGFRDEADKIYNGVWQQSYGKLSPKGQEKAREFQLRKKRSVLGTASRRQDTHSQAYVTQRLPKFYGSVLEGSVTTEALKEHGLQPALSAITIGKKYIDDAGLQPNVKTKLHDDLIKSTARDVAQKVDPVQYKKDAAIYDESSKNRKSIIGYSRGNLDKFKVANRSDGKKVDVAELKPVMRDKLSQLQQRIGKQLTINSGYRDPKHNAKVGGAKGSRHMHRDAVDLQWPKNASIQEKQQIIAHAKALNFKGFGIGNGILHLDMGRGRFWGYKNGKPTGNIPGWAIDALSGKVKVAKNSADGVQGQIANAAKKAGLDPEYMIRLASSESSFRPGVKAETSSATGLFQITGDTAKRLGTSHGKKSVDQEISDGIAITKANQKTMTNYLGRAPRNDELHLAHVFGAGRANGILSAKNETPIQKVLPPEVIKANRDGIFKTIRNVGQLKAWAKAKQNTKVDVASYSQRSTGTGDAFTDELFSKKNREIVEERWKAQQEQQFIAGVVSGDIRITGNDTEAMKVMNKAFNREFGPDTDFLRDKKASEFVLNLSKNKTVLPKRWFQKMEGYLSSAEPRDRELAFQLMDKVETNNPGNFNAGVGVQNLHKKLDQFRFLSEYHGPKGAVKQMMMAEERLSKMNVEELKAEKNKFIKDLDSEETLLEAFDDNIDFWPGSIFGAGTDQDPTLGISEAQKVQIKAEFKSLAVSEFEKTGNQELAKASALHMIKKRYGVSEITGHRSVMKYPPESFVDPEDVPFVKEQFQENSKEIVAKWSEILAKPGIKVIGEPILVSDEHTRKRYEEWLSGKKSRENSGLLMSGLSMIEKTRVLPEWRFALKVEINGETGYRLVDDYFSIEGLAQRSRERLEDSLLTNEAIGELVKEGKYRPNDPANFFRGLFNYEPREVVNKREELLNRK